MTTPIDPLKNEEFEDSKEKEAKERARYIASIDDPSLNNIWLKLNYYKEHYFANISEIALGLNLSRPLISEFLGDGKQRGVNTPKFSRGRIINLFKELTKEDNLNPLEGKKLTESHKRRRKLKKDGVDELLIAAGFVPENRKIVIVSPRLEPQLAFISVAYEDQPLSAEIFSQVIKAKTDLIKLEQIKLELDKCREEMENLKQKQSKKEELDESKISINLMNKLMNNVWIEEKIKIKVKEQYDQVLRSIGRDDLTPTESAGLLKSILNNQLNKHERFDLNLKIIGIERTSLSISWTKENNINTLLKEIEIVGNECEGILKLKSSNNKKYGSIQNKNSELPKHNYTLENSLFYPVTRTVVSCKYCDTKEKIDFECISTGTQLSTATSAIVQNMGFWHSISKMEMGMIWLGEDINALVDTTVTITDTSNEIVSGEWVSSDLMRSLLQALKIAGNKWFYKNCSDVKTVEYKLVIEETAKLKSDFYKCRKASDQFDIDNEPNDVGEFQLVNERAMKNITLIEEKLPEVARHTFLNTSHRINILCQLYRLHDFNIRVNHPRCRKLIEEIQSKLIDKSKKNKDKKIEIIKADDLFLIAARVLLCVEKIAYNLSFGTPYYNKSTQNLNANEIEFYLTENLLILPDIVEHFKKIDKKIEEKIISCKKDRGYDIYHSLGSYNSIVGRILFYRGDKKSLDEAFERFLKAAYYFQRIGLIVKVQRSLALAGRVKVRLGDKEMVKLCIELSESVLEDSRARLGTLEEPRFLSSIKSRVQLLKAESTLMINDNSGESIILCLDALKGALWLGLNRHIMDILHTGYLCTKDLQYRQVKTDLIEKFPELNEKEGKSKLIKNGGNNQVASRIANELSGHFQALIQLPDGGETTYWGNTTDQLKNFLIDTWNKWYRDASGDENGEHPFSIKIRADEFLETIAN